MTATTPINTTLPKIPSAKYEPLVVAASFLAEALQKIDERTAKETLESITALQSQLQKDRLALEKAVAGLAKAREEMKAASAIDDVLIQTAINVGRIFDFQEIADFQNQDEARLLTIEGLVSSFSARDGFAKAFSKRISHVAARTNQAELDLARSTTEYDHAGYTFSATYRALSQDIAFGRAIAAKHNVEVAKAAPTPSKKKVKSVAAPEQEVVVPAPTPVPPIGE